MIVTWAGKGGDLIWKSEMIVKDKTEVASWLCGVNWKIAILASCFLKSNEQEFSLEGVQS